MRKWMGAMAMLAAAPASAISMIEPAPRYHWECVPFAREVSGVRIFGDARTWWWQAEGRYARGHTPRVGAVMAFIPIGNMKLGHVATVSELVDDRTIKVTHANWSPIGGRRGQVERDVEVRDVSEHGDWSRVRVWFAPSEALGARAWPVHGFIYPTRTPKPLPGKAGAPRLEYADISSLTPQKPRENRLAYLGEVLRKLK